MARRPRTPDQFMQQALALAARGCGRTRPNPPVGAVVVRDGRVVGEGFHPRAGEPHAEVFALRQAGAAARGADLYVTLEPCCHHGRTGPCSEAILAAGIRRVFVGCIDPDPRMQGRGVAALRAAGLEVVGGVGADDCRRLLAPFAKHVATNRPLVTLKAAVTLDGQVATRTGDARWISCAESRERVHRVRDRVDAILTGIGTVLADDPRLTVRLPEGGGRTPLRVVVDSQLRLPGDAALLREREGDGVLVFTALPAGDPRFLALQQRGADVRQVTAGPSGLSLDEILAELGRAGCQEVLLEAGSKLLGTFLRAGLVDRVMLFVAPLMLGGADGMPLFAGSGAATLASAWRLQQVRIGRVGDDILVEGEVAHVHRAD